MAISLHSPPFCLLHEAGEDFLFTLVRHIQSPCTLSALSSTCSALHAVARERLTDMLLDALLACDPLRESFGNALFVWERSRRGSRGGSLVETRSIVRDGEFVQYFAFTPVVASGKIVEMAPERCPSYFYDDELVFAPLVQDVSCLSAPASVFARLTHALPLRDLRFLTTSTSMSTVPGNAQVVRSNAWPGRSVWCVFNADVRIVFGSEASRLSVVFEGKVYLPVQGTVFKALAEALSAREAGAEAESGFRRVTTYVGWHRVLVVSD